ncbi:hypothetical protein [Vibrio sp. 10N.261.51.F12]|uniref:aldose epimerase family protein n=1 Tax=Vibrio sp. 10N.261.51.F12 TaxID=3229679 RepID=UPI00355281C7
MESFILQNGSSRLVVAAQGACVLDFKVDDTPILKSRNLDSIKGTALLATQSACFPMAPFANRIRDNQLNLAAKKLSLPTHQADPEYFLHGNAWLKCWQLVSCTQSELTLELRSNTPEELSYHATICYRLSHRSLNIELSLENTAKHAVPINLGLHPFFVKERGDSLQMSCAGYWPQDQAYMPLEFSSAVPSWKNFSQAMPIPNRFINNGFLLNEAKVQLFSPSRAIKLTCSSNSLQWVVYQPQFEANGRESEFICIEPQQYEIDAQTRGSAAMINTGERASVSLLIGVEQL